MRYLQGDALKREPASVPDSLHPEEWQPVPKVVQTAPTPVNHTDPKRSIKQVLVFPGITKVNWPTIGAASVKQRARIATAVAAISILILLFWKGYTFYQLSSETMFHDMYVPFRTETNAAAKNSIEQYYATGNYVAATLQSKKQAQLTDRENLLTGLAYLHRDDLTKAIKWLEKGANNFKSPYRQQAGFYLALAYLKNEDYDQSIHQMEQIVNTPSHPYHSHFSARTIKDIKMLKWK